MSSHNKHAVKMGFILFAGEVKCLMTQLLKAVHHLHDNWILHRDLKTSNLLLSHKGILKVSPLSYGDLEIQRKFASYAIFVLFSNFFKYSVCLNTLYYPAEYMTIN